MMKYVQKIKFFAICIMLFIYCILRFKSTDMTIISLYGGIPVGGSIYFFLLMYFQFAIFSFYIFGSSAIYVESYGVLLIIRYRDRKIIIKKLLYRLTKDVFSLELIKLVIYGVLSILATRELTLSEVFSIGGFFFSDMLCTFVFLLFQVLIEINISPQIALVSVQSCYLAILFITDLLLQFYNDTIIHYVIIVNYQMMDHYYQMDGIFIAKISCFIGLFIIMLLISYKVGTSFFNRKDLV